MAPEKTDDIQLLDVIRGREDHLVERSPDEIGAVLEIHPTKTVRDRQGICADALRGSLRVINAVASFGLIASELRRCLLRTCLALEP